MEVWADLPMEIMVCQNERGIIMAKEHLRNLVMAGGRNVVMEYLDGIFYLTDDFYFDKSATDMAEEYPWATSTNITSHLLRRLERGSFMTNEGHRYRMLLEHVGMDPRPVALMQWNFGAMVLHLFGKQRTFKAKMDKYGDMTDQLGEMAALVQTLNSRSDPTPLDREFVEKQLAKLQDDLNESMKRYEAYTIVLNETRRLMRELLEEAYSGHSNTDLVSTVLKNFGIDFEKDKYDEALERAIDDSLVLEIPLLDEPRATHLIKVMQDYMNEMALEVKCHWSLDRNITLWKAIVDTNEKVLADEAKMQQP